jgi:hypothetical protein
VARAPRVAVAAGILAAAVGWGCGAKAPPRPPTAASAAPVRAPEGKPPAEEPAGAGGAGGAGIGEGSDVEGVWDDDPGFGGDDGEDG